MTGAADRIQYVLVLSVEEGWPDESLVPAAEELAAMLETPISVSVMRRVPNPVRGAQRYYALEAEPTVTPTRLVNALISAIEEGRVGMWPGREIRVAVVTPEGTTLAQGTAIPRRP